MKLSATYDRETSLLILCYDTEVQAIFDETARTMARLLHPNGAPSRLEADPDWYEDIGQNTEILAQLASEPSRRLCVRSDHLFSLLNLACWTTLRLFDEKQRVESFRDLLMLLSTITPIEIQPVDLPPAAEVLDRKTQQAAWTSLEMLRSWTGGDFPELSVFQAYSLGVALHKISKPKGTLKTLLATLDGVTYVFRCAMEALAIKEITEMARKRRKR